MLDPGFGTIDLFTTANRRRDKLLKGIKGRIRRGTDRYGTDELSNAGIDFETSKRSGNPYAQIEFLEGTPRGKQQLYLNAAKAKKDNKNKNDPYRSQHEQHIIY